MIKGLKEELQFLIPNTQEYVEAYELLKKINHDRKIRTDATDRSLRKKLHKPAYKKQRVQEQSRKTRISASKVIHPRSKRKN